MIFIAETESGMGDWKLSRSEGDVSSGSRKAAAQKESVPDKRGRASPFPQYQEHQ